MDADLAHLKEFSRFREAVEYLLEPLLKFRDIAPMPCKHHRTFEWARQERQEMFAEIGEELPSDDEGSMEMPAGYCDCIPFDRRAELWEIAEDCVKVGLSNKQMTEIAAIMTVMTSETFTYNNYRAARSNQWNGDYKDFIRALKRQRKKGLSLTAAMPGLIVRWQWRMMPNA